MSSWWADRLMEFFTLVTIFVVGFTFAHLATRNPKKKLPIKKASGQKELNGWIDFNEQQPAIGQWVVLGYGNNITIGKWGSDWGSPFCWYPVPNPPNNTLGKI